MIDPYLRFGASDSRLAHVAPHNGRISINIASAFRNRNRPAAVGQTSIQQQEVNAKMLTSAGVPVESEAETSAPDPARPTLFCFSHLRWDFVFQRPQHLMSRFAREMNVVIWEEPKDIGPRETAYLQVRQAEDVPNVRMVVPHLPRACLTKRAMQRLRRLLDAHVARSAAPDHLVLHADDAALLAAARRRASSSTTAWTSFRKFRFAPEKLLDLEQELIDRADIVFTGGSSLYEAKKDRHDSVHCFPSSVDRAHFAKARAAQFDPADQEELPRPRLGFYGVIDERFDIELLAKVAKMRPDWSFVMVGPVVKIDAGRTAAAPEHPLSRRQDLRPAAGLSVGLGRRADAVRDEQVDAIHLADQDARISRWRKAGRVDPGPRRGAPLRPTRRCADRRRRRRVSSPPARKRSSCREILQRLAR